MKAAFFAAIVALALITPPTSMAEDSPQSPQPAPGKETATAPAGARNAGASRLQFRLEAEADDAIAETLPGRTEKESIRLGKTPVLDGSAVASASKIYAPHDGSAEILLRFTEQGASKFAEITKACVGRRIAILFDGRVLATPRIMAEITGGEAAISGGNLTYADITSILEVFHGAGITETGR
jgi:preprotein translocase subunit SecD